MLELRHKAVEIRVPQCWAELRLEQWLALQKVGQDQLQIVSILTGLPVEVVERLDEKSVSLIAGASAFLGRMFDVTKWITPSTITIDGHTFNPKIDVKEKEYGQKVWLHEVMKGGDKFINNLVTICEIYFQTLITKKHYDPELADAYKEKISKEITLPDAYAIASDYSQQVTALLKMEQATLNKPPSEEQLAAGIHLYDEFGIMNTIRALAGGDILKVDEVLRKDYNTVYLWLKMAKTDGQFNDNYNAYMRRKNKAGK